MENVEKQAKTVESMENMEIHKQRHKQEFASMIRIGIVGVGFMGMIHYLAAHKVKGARVTAVSSRDPKKLTGDWRGIQGNFGPAGKQMDLGRVTGYADLPTSSPIRTSTSWTSARRPTSTKRWLSPPSKQVSTSSSKRLSPSTPGPPTPSSRPLAAPEVKPFRG